MEKQVAVCIDLAKREVLGSLEREVAYCVLRDGTQRIIEVTDIFAAGLEQINDVLWVRRLARLPAEALDPALGCSRQVVKDRIVTYSELLPLRGHIGAHSNPGKILGPGTGSVRQRDNVEPPKILILRKPIPHQFPAFVFVAVAVIG